MKFKTDFLKELIQEESGDYSEYGFPEVKVIENEIYDTRRWSIDYNMIFQIGNDFYETCYSVGATESQDESPYDDEGEDTEVTEVVPVEVKTIKYVKKEN